MMCFEGRLDLLVVRVEEEEKSKHDSGAEVLVLCYTLESPGKFYQNLNAQLIPGHQLNQNV